MIATFDQTLLSLLGVLRRNLSNLTNLVPVDLKDLQSRLLKEQKKYSPIQWNGISDEFDAKRKLGIFRNL